MKDHQLESIKTQFANITDPKKLNKRHRTGPNKTDEKSNEITAIPELIKKP